VPVTAEPTSDQLRTISWLSLSYDRIGRDKPDAEGNVTAYGILGDDIVSAIFIIKPNGSFERKA
jgi:hypothetical protein